MQSHRHAMRANLSPFPRFATVAEILNVYRALDHHRGAERNLAPLHHPAQQRWRPVGTEHFALLQVSACPFHHIPTGGGAEQGFCEFNWHSNQYAGGISHGSRTHWLMSPGDSLVTHLKVPFSPANKSGWQFARALIDCSHNG